MDVHQATISVAVMDSAAKLILESILETKGATVLQFIGGLRGSLLVTFEEGTSAAWLYDLLKLHVANVLVCDPRKNALLKDGSKSDRIDARKLAELLRGNQLSPIYHGENGVRTLKLAPRQVLGVPRIDQINLEAVFIHSGIPFSVLSTPYSANGNGIVNGSGPQFASIVPGVPLYEHNPIPGVTQPGTLQWLNPNAFVSTVDASTGTCVGGDTPANCRFGDLGRNALRGPDFTWSDFYLTKWFPLSERWKLRFDVQFFNVFNHPNFGLPSMVLAGIPGKPSTQTGFGALTYTTSFPTGLLGVGLGGDSTPRMIAFQLRLDF
jgi:hypothetical protein